MLRVRCGARDTGVPTGDLRTVPWWGPWHSAC